MPCFSAFVHSEGRTPRRMHTDILHPTLQCQLFASPLVLCLGSRPNAFICLLKPNVVYPITWRPLCTPGGHEQPLGWRCCGVRVQSCGIVTSFIPRIRRPAVCSMRRPMGICLCLADIQLEANVPYGASPYSCSFVRSLVLIFEQFHAKPLQA